MQSEQRKEERRESRSQHEQAEHNTDDVGEAGQENWDEPDQEHPESHERHGAERLKTEAGIHGSRIGTKSLASQAVESQLKRRVGPEECKERAAENEPRRSSEQCRDQAILDERAQSEGDRRSR
jgi:hypothetical protein